MGALSALGAPALEFVLGALKLLLDPKVWLLIVVAAAAGFVKGCVHEEVQFNAYKTVVASVGKAQEAWTKQRNAANKAAQQEVENVHKAELAIAAADLDAAEHRLQLNTSRGFVPGAGLSTGKPLLGGATATDPIVPLDNGLVCFDPQELDRRIRASVDRLQQRLAGLAERCVTALSDGGAWNLWAGKVGACPVTAAAAGAPALIPQPLAPLP